MAGTHGLLGTRERFLPRACPLVCGVFLAMNMKYNMSNVIFLIIINELSLNYRYVSAREAHEVVST